MPGSGTVPCNGRDVFSDVNVDASKKCYVRNYSGSWTPAPLNSDGFFYSRVKVCDQDASGKLLDVRDYGIGRDFCTRYPNNQFKPTGTIQKYSNSFRLAAFGYALDLTRRYGGVLRAPMKWVGSKTYDTNGQENTPAGGNAAAEWDPQTGIFKTNPDGDTTQTPAISGVINYLNKFGRTGPKPGRYKDYDPVGELYYETLRYLQGLQSSSQAVDGLTPGMYDGFPIFTDWTALDPFANGSSTGDYTCVKSNIVTIGDIETWDYSDYARFPSPDLSKNHPNFKQWRDTVAAFEGGLVTEYFDGQNQRRETGNPNSPNLYAFGNQFDIVGTAYWAHTQDIRGVNWTDQKNKQRPGLRVKSFFFDVNAYGKQNDETTRRYKNQFFLAAKYGGFESTSSPNDSAQPYNPWGNPFVDKDEKPNNDVWQDPSNPGEASAYARQSDARSVLVAFDKIFARAGERIRSIAGAASQSGTLTAAGNVIYQAEFSSQDWSGDLAAYAVSTNDANVVQLASTPVWRAAERLKALTDIGTRKIVVGNSGATSSQTASNFTWDSISDDLKQSLDRDPYSGSPSVADGFAEDRLNFIRGDHSKEVSRFRDRDGQRLGDIVNSGVVYSGAPSSTIQSTTYAEFFKDNKDRKAAVFVGANDGMLHAFAASNGDELFGYIPSWLGPKLSALTSKKYLDNHQAYVDATPVVAEAQVGTAGTKADWKTVLVSGTGAGGRGVFALDVTDPTQFSASKVMWEFTSADDIDLGYVVGRPQILKFRTSAPNENLTYKWFAVVASGVNNYVRDDAGNFSSTGQPALFLLDLAKAPGEAWSLDKNYHKISLPADVGLSATKATGLLNFKVTLGAQQEVSKVFMGDLHGNLWKLDFKDKGSGDWNMSTLSAFVTDGVPYPLYIAKDGLGNVQPISAAPFLIRGEGQESIYVAFGTGKYLEGTDRSSTAVNSFYVVHDDGTKKADSTGTPTSVITGRGRLQAGVFDSKTGRIDVSAFVWGRPATDTDNTQRSGWYFDFPATGERQVFASLLRGDTLVFSSLIPDQAANASSCSPTGGSGREYRLDVNTGDGTSSVSTVGLLGASMAMDVEAATESTITDSTGRRTRTIKTQTLSQGSTGLATSATVTTVQIAGRLSWRQIHNYQDLRNK